MDLFTSDRERRLWLWALAAVVAIYSTLGLARTLAGILQDHGILGASFVFAMFLIAAAVIAQALTRPTGVIEIGVLLGVVAVYGMVFLRMAIPEERSHLIEYGIVALLIYEALSERASQGRHVPRTALLAIAVTTVIGVIDECIQAVLPSRVFDIRDILFNFLAGVMAITASAALGWARRRDSQGRNNNQKNL